MARMLTLTLMAVGVLLVFSIVGIEIIGFSAAGDILKLATNQITASEFFNSLFSLDNGILLLAVGGAIIAGLFARAQLENLIILPFITGVLIGLISSFVGISTYAASFGGSFAWVGSLLQVFMGLFTVAYIFTCVEFFRGNI